MNCHQCKKPLPEKHVKFCSIECSSFGKSRKRLKRECSGCGKIEFVNNSTQLKRKCRSCSKIGNTSSKNMSLETKRKISESRKKKDITPWNKGKIGIYTEETKIKMRAKNKGKVLSNDHKNSISKGLFKFFKNNPPHRQLTAEENRIRREKQKKEKLEKKVKEQEKLLEDIKGKTYSEILKLAKSDRKAAKLLGIGRTQFNTLLSKEMNWCGYPGCRKEPMKDLTRCEEHRKVPQDLVCKRESNKKWRSQNKERLRKYAKKYYWDNHEERRRYHNEWEKTPEQREKARLRNHKRREKYSHDTISYEDLKIVQKSFDNKCFNCGSTDRVELDHHIPRSKGGLLTLDNTVLLCKSCNSGKRDRNPEDYYTPEKLEQLSQILKKQSSST